MKLSIFPILFLVIFYGCKEQTGLSGQIQIAENSPWENVVYLIQPRNFGELATNYSGLVLDSARIHEDGSFQFDQLPDAPVPIVLTLAVQQKGARFFNKMENEHLQEANYFPFIWKNGDHLEIKATIDHFQGSFSIRQASQENQAILDLRDIRIKAYKVWKEIEANAPEDSQLLVRESAKLDYQEALIGFADETQFLLPALIAIRWVSPNNDFERIPEFLIAQCQKWKQQNAEHAWVNELCQLGQKSKLPVLIGDKLPDVELPMSTGEISSVHQLLGSRMTIIDLWASWCAPCRKENKEVLLPLWKQFHTEGLQIIAYALDSSDPVWKRAIDKDGADHWSHASHLQGDDAPFLENLRIQTIPANYILDEKGVILAKNLHGEALVRFVEAYLRN